MEKPAMESNDHDGAILPSSSSVSELDVDAYFEKKSTEKAIQAQQVANESMAQQSTTVHTDSGTAGEDEQPPSVTFIDSQSYDVDEITVDTNQAEGLDTVPSLEDRGFISRSLNSVNDMNNSKTEDNSCNSGSNCSTAEVTARTRLETMDSTGIDYGYDVDHRSGTPLPPAKIRSNGSSFRKSHQSTTLNGQEQPAPPSGCTQFARRIEEHWCTVTKKLRDGMLYVLVETSVLAAQWPRTTIAIVTCTSFALIAAGFFTNFHLRLDNEKIFTPTSSEVLEHSEFLGNFRMYQGTEYDVNYERRRQLSQARTLQKLIQQRKLKTTFNIFNEDSNPDEQYSFTTTPLDTNSNSPSLAPSAVESLTDRLEEDSEPADVVATNSMEVMTIEEVEEEEERYYERGKGLPFPILVHQNTENVFTIQGVQKLFDLIDYIKTIPGYADACNGDEWSFHNFYGENTCELRSITRFWNHNRTLFEEQIKTEEDLFDAADEIFYPDGGYADLPFVLAEFEQDEHGRPVSGQAYIFFIMFKHDWAYNSMTDHLLQLQADWASDPRHNLILEFVAPNSFAREAFQSVWGDLPLLPTVFVVMCGFTMLVFLKCHKVYSRCLLGVGAVTTIMMSIMSGYGLLFICGVPITVMTNMLIFVIFGIGLDDTFIITGAYFRTNRRDSTVSRVRSTMEAVGSSILLTTITTSTAFILGCTSTIEPIRWLCLYAFPAIIIDFVYQITFFMAFLVLDEQRIQSNRMDCCFCVTVENGEDCDTNDEDGSLSPDDQDRPQQHEPSESSDAMEKGNQETEMAKDGHGEPSDHIADRFMRWFASRLMHPSVKIIVMVVFALFAALCAYKTTQMRQRFNFKDLLPKGSYAASYADAVELYSDRAIALKITFRFVDQSDEDIRNQMESYVDELIEKVDALNEPPPIFWAREFRTAIAADPSLQGLPFYDQVRQLLHNPAVNDAIGKDIQWRPDGTILASQVRIYVTDLDMDNVRSQIEFMQQQRAVAVSQPINKGRKLWAFFAYDLLLHIFAFYEVAAGELALTTATSVMAVCVIALVLIPHWSAVPIILPLLSVLYIEMLGILQIFGYAINVVTYVILVVSIGLLVDFIMHILLRYYESEYDTREEKVKDALGTMGASILVGGLSTFLGVTPLLFSASEILSTVCIAFLAMVFLGVTHGLIVLPVILSYIGTETVVRHRKRLSLVDFAAAASAALSEKFQSMDFSHGRHHPSLENCRSKSHESELQI